MIIFLESLVGAVRGKNTPAGDGPLEALRASRRQLLIRAAPFAIGPAILIVIELAWPSFRHWVEHHLITTTFATSVFVVGLTATLITERERLRERERKMESVISATLEIGKTALLNAAGVAAAVRHVHDEIARGSPQTRGAPDVMAKIYANAHRQVRDEHAELTKVAERWLFLEADRVEPIFDYWRILDVALDRLAKTLKGFEESPDPAHVSYWWGSAIEWLESIARNAERLAHATTRARKDRALLQERDPSAPGFTEPILGPQGRNPMEETDETLEEQLSDDLTAAQRNPFEDDD